MVYCLVEYRDPIYKSGMVECVWLSDVYTYGFCLMCHEYRNESEQICTLMH